MCCDQSPIYIFAEKTPHPLNPDRKLFSEALHIPERLQHAMAQLRNTSAQPKRNGH